MSLTAAILISTSIMIPGVEMTQWLPVMQNADVIALAEVSESDDLAPEYRILDGIVGVASDARVRIGVKWPHPLPGWPEIRGAGSKRLIFAVNGTHDLNAVQLEDALPFLIAERNAPAYLESVSLTESDLQYLLSGPSPTFDEAVALVRQFIKGDDTERRRLLLEQHLLRVYQCGLPQEHFAMCAKLAGASSLTQLIDVAVAADDSGRLDVFDMLALACRYAGTQQCRAHLQTLGGDYLKQFNDYLASYGVRDGTRNHVDGVLAGQKPLSPHSDEQIRQALATNAWIWISLADMLAFAREHCDFMIKHLTATVAASSGWDEQEAMTMALVTGRACSPCPRALIGLERTAKNDWAALAPTTCRDNPDIAKLFASKRYGRLREVTQLYFIVWLAEHDQYPDLDNVTYVFARWASSAPSREKGLANQLSFVIERKARAAGRTPPTSLDTMNLRQYAEWLEKNADLFKGPSSSRATRTKTPLIWRTD